MGRGYLLVEGHGEVQAAGNLVVRLWQDLALPPLPWTRPLRWTQLHQRRGVSKACAYVRSRGDAAALLILRDEDDACPRAAAPAAARWIADERLPFPAAVVLLHREYEVLFLPCLERMAGVALKDDRGIERPGLLAGTRFAGDWEARRDVKGWLSANFPPGRSYKPTLDQLPMTRLLDFALLRASGLACFGSLERGLRSLAEHLGTSSVYPTPSLELGRPPSGEAASGGPAGTP